MRHRVRCCNSQCPSLLRGQEFLVLQALCTRLCMSVYQAARAVLVGSVHFFVRQASVQSDAGNARSHGPVGVPPLAHEALEGRVETVMLLLEHDADPTGRVEGLGWPPVACAVAALVPECVEVLLEATDRESVTPLTLPLDWEQCLEYIQASTRTLVPGKGTPPGTQSYTPLCAQGWVRAPPPTEHPHVSSFTHINIRTISGRPC